MEKMDVEVIDQDTKRKRSSSHCLFIILVFILFLVAAALVIVLIYFLFIRTCSLTEQISQKNSTTSTSDETDTTYDYEVPSDAVEFFRLPQTIIPLHYNISLTPYFYDEDVPADRERFTFDGRVKIEIRCIEDTDRIFIHAESIMITQLSVVSSEMNNSANLVESYEEDGHNSILNISLTENILMDGNYVLDIAYIGYISNDTIGFFVTSFEDESGTERWGGVTQMQPSWARRVVPCFDEPGLKAEFDVTIRHRADMTALSNGIELSEVDLDGNMTGWKETVFKTTPIMPPYLLAFAVTHYVSMNKIISTGTMIRVWSSPQTIQHAQYALDVAAKYTEFCNELFDYEYHLEKQDMLATPRMFSAGMENWGLIIYNDEAMIYNPEENTIFRKDFVARVVSHEIVHQWFGNLVSCKWWDDIWLNEGLTEYWQYAALQHAEPGWDVESSLLEDGFMYAMEEDEPKGEAVPVKPDTSYVSETRDYFSGLAYFKGASVARMLRAILGDDVFLLGMRQFLKTFTFDNAVSDDFWNLLTEVDANHGGHDVKTIMDGWILEPYYPVVTLHRGQDNRTVNVSQSVFLTWPENELKRAEIGAFNWHIPITYTYESRGSIGFKTPNRTWLYGEQTGEFSLPSDIQPSDWYLANIGFNMYYRVNYDGDNWKKLAEQLLRDHTVIPMANRYQILNDAYSMFVTNAFDIQTLLDLTLYMDKETRYLPWLSATYIMGKLKNMLRTHPSFPLLKTYWLDKVNLQYETLGWPSNDQDLPPKRRRHQLIMLREACKFGNQHCLQTLTEQYRMLMNNGTPPIFKFISQLDIVSCLAIEQGGEREWDFAMEQMQLAEFFYDKEQWLYGLCCSREAWRLNTLLHDLHTGKLRLDAYDSGFERAVQFMSFSEFGLHVAWNYVQENFQVMVDDYRDYFYGTGSEENYDEEYDETEPVIVDLANLMHYLSLYLMSDLYLKQLIDLSETFKTELNYDDVFASAIHIVKDNVMRISNFADKAGTWFEQHV